MFGLFKNKEIKNKEIICHLDKVDLTFKNATMNTLILGATGSGKTSTVILPILQGLIKNNLSGLIIDVKNDFSDNVRKLAKMYDREKDILEIGKYDTSANINLINGLKVEDVLFLIRKIVVSSETSNDTYWIEQGFSLFEDIIKIYYYVYEKELELKKDNTEYEKKLVKPSLYILAKCLIDHKLAKNIYKIFEDLFYGTYILEDMKQKIDSYEFHFLKEETQETDKSSKAQQLSWTIGKIIMVIKFFTEEENISKFSNVNDDEFTLDFKKLFYEKNKIIILRFSLKENVIGGLISKMIRQKSISDIMEYNATCKQKDNIPYTFSMIDEFQNIASFSDDLNDSEWFDKSRSFKNLQIVSTQSLSSLYSKSKNSDMVNTLINNCRNKILLNNDDSTTLEYFDNYVKRLDTKNKIKELMNLKSGEYNYFYFDTKVRTLLYKNGSLNNILEEKLNSIELPEINNKIEEDIIQEIIKLYSLKEDEKNKDVISKNGFNFFESILNKDFTKSLLLGRKDNILSTVINILENKINNKDILIKFEEETSIKENIKLLNSIKDKYKINDTFFDKKMRNNDEEILHQINLIGIGSGIAYTDFEDNFDNKNIKINRYNINDIINDYKIKDKESIDKNSFIFKNNCINVFLIGGNISFLKKVQNESKFISKINFIIEKINLRDNNNSLNVLGIGHADFDHEIISKVDYNFTSPSAAAININKVIDSFDEFTINSLEKDRVYSEIIRIKYRYIYNNYFMGEYSYNKIINIVKNSQYLFNLFNKVGTDNGEKNENKNKLGYEVKYTSKDEALEAVKKYGKSLEYASDELKNDKEFILEVVKEKGYALKYASEELKNDKEVVLEAVKKYGKSLEYASEELKNDKEFIKEALNIHINVFLYIYKKWQKDTDIIELYNSLIETKEDDFINDEED